MADHRTAGAFRPRSTLKEPRIADPRERGERGDASIHFGCIGLTLVAAALVLAASSTAEQLHSPVAALALAITVAVTAREGDGIRHERLT